MIIDVIQTNRPNIINTLKDGGYNYFAQQILCIYHQPPVETRCIVSLQGAD